MRPRNSTTESPRAFPEGPSPGLLPQPTLAAPGAPQTLPTNLLPTVCPDAGRGPAPLAARSPTPRPRRAADTEGSPPRQWRPPLPQAGNRVSILPARGISISMAAAGPGHGKAWSWIPASGAAPLAGPGAAGRPPRPRPGPAAASPPGFLCHLRPSPAQPPPAAIETFHPPEESRAPPISAPPACLPPVPSDRNRGLGLPPPSEAAALGSLPARAARSPSQRQPASGTPFGGNSTNAPLLRSPSCPPSAELFLDLHTCPSSGVSRNVFAGQALPDPQVPDLSGDSVGQQRFSSALLNPRDTQQGLGLILAAPTVHSPKRPPCSQALLSSCWAGCKQPLAVLCGVMAVPSPAA